MLSNLKKSNSKGFTIIEVMIVLAIAGLIMLVVFLAVPTLQRNQRNSGRRADASRLASAANDFVTNSNGAAPSTTGNADTIINSAGTLSNLGTLTNNGAAAAACGAGGALPSGKLKICTGATTAAFTGPVGVAGPPPVPASDGVVIATAAQCNGADQASAGSARQMAIFYSLETGNGYSVACINI
jgi:prepilin-type N-terminal cleavage/methylation domain-containing protein